MRARKKLLLARVRLFAVLAVLVLRLIDFECGPLQGVVAVFAVLAGLLGTVLLFAVRHEITSKN